MVAKKKARGVLSVKKKYEKILKRVMHDQDFLKLDYNQLNKQILLKMTRS